MSGPSVAPRFIGIAGGSGAGKTVLARAVATAWPGSAAVIAQDAYYRDLSHLPEAARGTFNFDEPAAMECDRLGHDLEALRGGAEVAIPVYDFSRHTRTAETRVIARADLVVVEGLFVLNDAALRAQLDLCIFVDAPCALRLARRIARDCAERGRDRDEACTRFLEHAEPMFERYIAPARAYADMIVSGEGPLDAKAASIVAAINSMR